MTDTPPARNAPPGRSAPASPSRQSLPPLPLTAVAGPALADAPADRRHPRRRHPPARPTRPAHPGTGRQHHRHPAGRRDLADRETGQLERHPAAVRPRHGRARRGQPRGRFLRPDHRQVPARPRLRAGRFVLRHHRFRHGAGARGPGRRGRHLPPAGRHADDDHRLGHVAGRRRHRRTARAASRTVRRRPVDVRRAGRRRRTDGLLPGHPVRAENPASRRMSSWCTWATRCSTRSAPCRPR